MTTPAHEPPGWRSLLDQALALHETQAASRFVQLATVRPDGRPANRTLNFRAFLPDGRLVFTADSRSEKCQQLAANSWAEACWYFAQTREQFRLLGPVVLATERDETLNAVRQATWRDRTEAARQTFTWPPPGTPRATADAFTIVAPTEPPGHFVLLVLAPHQVDYLDLRPSPFDRRLFQLADGNWRDTSVNP